MQVALDHAANGYHVHPLRQGQKAPRLGGWEKRATTDPDQIRQWWSEHPTDNVGIAPGLSGLLIIDPDAGTDTTGKVKEGPKAWRGWLAENRLTGNPTVNTPSGGEHWYYRTPEPVRNRTGFLPNVDAKSANGNIVAPGSVFDGRTYTTPGGAHDLPLVADLPDAPEALLGLLRQEKAPRTAEPLGAAGVEAAFEREIQAVLDAPDGTGNDTINRAAYNLGQLVGPTPRLNEDRVRDALNDAGRRIKNPAGKVAATVESGLAKGKQNPREVVAVAKNTGRIPLNDSELAEWVASHLRGRVCWAGGLGWQQWDGRVWAPITTPGITEVVRALLLKQYREELETADSDRRKSLSQLLNRGKIGAVVGLLQGQVEEKADQFDTKPDLLNVGNGVVDLKTGKLQPHDPALMLTKITKVNYREGANHPDWTKALEAIPDPEVRDWLQIKLGQGVTGHPGDDDVMPILRGGGSNGKTTVLTTLLNALGQHATAVPEKLLLANPSDHPTELMTLRGTRFALLEELPEGRNLSVQRLKQTVGKPRLVARLIRADNVEWDATHTLFVTTNYDVRVTETDHGTWRRLAVISFPLTYRRVGEALRSKNDRTGDDGLRARLLRGRQGQFEAALAWAIAGARKWYANGQVTPPQPARVRADTDALRSKTDLVLAFATEQLTFDPNGAVKSSDLLLEFNRWAEEQGHARWADQTFAARLEAHDTMQAHGVTKGGPRRVPELSLPGGQTIKPKSVVRAWTGIRFRTEEPNQQTLTEETP